MYSLPTDGQYKQPNEGESLGNIYATFNIDLDSKPGLIRLGEATKTVLTDADNANFAGYAAAILFDPTDQRYVAVSDKVFGATNPTGTWTEDTAGSEPNSGNTVMDAVFFDGLLLVSEAQDIKAYNGTTWSSWWQTTLGQSALALGERHLMKVAADGNLYIVDNGNKVYKVPPVGSPSTSGNGTLDLSATFLQITAIGATSNRLWLGTDTQRYLGISGETYVIEWDMSPSSATFNRQHYVGSAGVSCIAVWNDTPIVVLKNGIVKYYNGSAFVDFPGIKFPVPEDVVMDSDWLHPNGWSIIDNLPHFLISGKIDTTSNTYEEHVLNADNLPSGVWCLDPEIGLYHRFAIGSGGTTQSDYGMASVINVGALFGLTDSSTKFLCSYEYFVGTGTQRSVLAYHDMANSRPVRGHIITPAVQTFGELLKQVSLYHKKLSSGEKIRVYYREEPVDPTILQGTWLSTTRHNTLTTGTGLEQGDIVFVKQGKGAGQWLHITNVEETDTVTALTVDANSFVVNGDAGTLEGYKFKKIVEIDDTTQDIHINSIPNQKTTRKMQFLIVLEQVADNKMELDNVIITT